MVPEVAGSDPVDRPISLLFMSPLVALILGIVQGLTEFLPISSSAHLKLARLLLNEPAQTSPLFDLSCHLGTLLALLFALRLSLRRLLFEERSKLFTLFLALLPLFPAYFLLKPLRDVLDHTRFLGPFLMLTGALLLLSEKLTLKRASAPDWKKRDALFIGSMQAIALLPGISRSGATIACARTLGWQKEEAATFSFLLFIPAALGGTCLELLKLKTAKGAPIDLSFASCLIGFLSSLAVGALCVRGALKWMQSGSLMLFGIYCLALGALVKYLI